MGGAPSAKAEAAAAAAVARCGLARLRCGMGWACWRAAAAAPASASSRATAMSDSCWRRCAVRGYAVQAHCLAAQLHVPAWRLAGPHLPPFSLTHLAHPAVLHSPLPPPHAHQVLSPEDCGRGFSEVGAMQEAKAALREAVQLPLKHPELFAGAGAAGDRTVDGLAGSGGQLLEWVEQHLPLRLAPASAGTPLCPLPPIPHPRRRHAGTPRQGRAPVWPPRHRQDPGGACRGGRVRRRLPGHQPISGGQQVVRGLN